MMTKVRNQESGARRDVLKDLWSIVEIILQGAALLLELYQTNIIFNLS